MPMIAREGELPLFRQMNPQGLYYDDTLYPEGTEFFFTDTPNDWLEPLNEAARVAKDEWCDKQDALHEKYCEKVGRPYTPRPRDWREGVAMRREDVLAERDAAEAAAKPAVRKLQTTKRLPVPPQGHLRSSPSGDTFSAAKRANKSAGKLTGVKMPVAPGPAEAPKPILGKNFEEMLPGRG